MPLVISSLGGGHTYIHANTQTYINQYKNSFKNQVCAGLWLMLA